MEVQGHADERGTTDYNLALGERRARAVRTTLVELGVPHRRVTTVSFGEEAPMEVGAEASIWARNRRAEFRILDGANTDVAGTVE